MKIKNKNTFIAVAVTLLSGLALLPSVNLLRGFQSLAVGIASADQNSTIAQKLAEPLPPVGEFSAETRYPTQPVGQTAKSDLYVNLTYRLYTNYNPFYFRDASTPDGDSSQPYTKLYLTRNGKVIYSCQKDYPIYDTCNSWNWNYPDNNPPRGQTYTYGAYVEQYSRAGQLLQTSSPVTATAYVGNANPASYQISFGYNGKVIGPNMRPAAQVPVSSKFTLSWSQNDPAGSQYAGDVASNCDVLRNGTVYRSAAGASGSLTVDVGPIAGQQTYAVRCPLAADPNLVSSVSGSLTAVDSLPADYYGTAPTTGGGGSAIAVPETSNYAGDLDGNAVPDSQQPELVNIFSPKSGSYVLLQSDICSVKSSSFLDDKTSGEDKGFLYPFGVMNFTLNCPKAGETSTVTKYFYTDLNPGDLAVRKLNLNTKVYSTISAASISKIEINGKSAIKVTYAVTDGGELDEDGKQNGIIVDPVGLADIDQSAFLTASGSCKSGEFFGLPTWHKYLSGHVDGAGNCSPVIGKLADTLLIPLAIIDLMVRLIVFLAVGFVIYGGIIYIMSQGKPDETKRARQTIIQALVGLSIALIAIPTVVFVARSIQ